MRTTVILFLLAGIAHADTVTLKNRVRLQGRILKEDTSTITIETYKYGTIRITRAQVKSIKRGPSKLDKYDEKRKKIEDTAKAHYDLGKWCKRSKLLFVAKKEWEKAVEIDPDHKAARKALGYVRVDGAWITEVEHKTSKGFVKYKGKWIKKARYEKLRLSNAIALKIKVGIKPDADRKFLLAMKERIQKAAEKWWICTEGQMYIQEAHIVDKTSDGEVVINNLDSVKAEPGKTYGRTRPGGILLGAKFPLVTFCHEMGHYKFGVPDEYWGAQKCPSCVMEPWKGVFAFCDKTNHVGKGEDCWSIILKKHRKWKHPNRGYGKCPPIKITIEDK